MKNATKSVKLNIIDFGWLNLCFRVFLNMKKNDFNHLKITSKYVLKYAIQQPSPNITISTILNLTFVT